MAEPAVQLPSGRAVLIAVDDSPASEAAVTWAIHQFYKPGDTFHLVNVINESTTVDAYYSEKALTEKAVDFIEKRFVPLVVSAEIPFKIDIVRKAEDGEPIGEAIVRYGHHLQTPAIIMAKHDKEDVCVDDVIRQRCTLLMGVCAFYEGIKKFFMGSVARYVSEHAIEPVVVLK